MRTHAWSATTATRPNRPCLPRRGHILETWLQAIDGVRLSEDTSRPMLGHHVVDTIDDGIETVSCYGIRQLERDDVVGVVNELVHDAPPAIIGA